MPERRTLRMMGLTGALVLGAFVTEAAAIVVAPTAVTLSDRDPSASVTLYNSSDVPEEVDVSVVFGYPATDSAGVLGLVLDENGDDPQSAADWIQVLPRRLVVPPGERRVVRLLGRPPRDLPEGEYWSRLVLTARGQDVPVDGADASAEVQVGLSLQVRTIIAANFRKGRVNTGVEVGDFDPRVEGDSLVLFPDLVRQGNGAFIGLLEAQLVDGEGQIAASWEEQVAVYRAYRRRYAWDVSHLPAGTYEFQLRLSTERDDVNPRDRLPAAPVIRTAEVVLSE